MSEKNQGQAMIGRVREWIGGYMSFSDEGYSLVLALWALNTWVFDRFDATPYLAITAATKQAGKTRLMELLRMICQNGRMFGDMTPAAMFRLIGAYDSKLTIFFDEAEKLSSGAAGVMRSVMNTGYRRGQKVTRAKAGGGVDEFPVYGPKCFALIGDVNDTLRDRSIVLTLERGQPGREFDFSVAEGEAAALVTEMRHAFVHGWPASSPQGFLGGRDREIWSPLFGVAEALHLDKATMDELTRVAADLVAGKTAKRRHFVDAAADEDGAIDTTYADRALADLVAVLGVADKTHTGDIFSAVAVEKMRELPAGPWRTYRGKGLDVDTLAKLVSRFGLHTRVVRMVKGRAGKALNGYSRRDVLASAPKA